MTHSRPPSDWEGQEGPTRRRSEGAAGASGGAGEPGLDPVVLRARDGDARAFGELFDRNAPWVYARLRRMLGPGADIEDLVQEVFLRAHRSLPAFRGQARFETWLRRICARVAYDQMRAGRARPTLQLVELDSAASGCPEPEHREAARHLRRLIDRLPPQNRAVLVLHDVEGFTAEEIQKVVAAPSVNTVKSRLRLARAELHRLARGMPALRWLYEDEDGGES